MRGLRFHNGVDEDSMLLGCDALCVGKQLPTFQRSQCLQLQSHSFDMAIHPIRMCSCVFLCYVCIAVFTLDVGLLARSQYSGGPATGHLDTGFSWFPCGYKQMLRWFPKFQVATTCFSCSPPDLNLLVTSFIFCIHVK